MLVFVEEDVEEELLAEVELLVEVDVDVVCLAVCRPIHASACLCLYLNVSLFVSLCAAASLCFRPVSPCVFVGLFFCAFFFLFPLVPIFSLSLCLSLFLAPSPLHTNTHAYILIKRSRRKDYFSIHLLFALGFAHNHLTVITYSSILLQDVPLPKLATPTIRLFSHRQATLPGNMISAKAITAVRCMLHAAT